MRLCSVHPLESVVIMYVSVSTSRGLNICCTASKYQVYCLAAHIRPFMLTLQKEKLQEKNFNVFWEFRAVAVELK